MDVYKLRPGLQPVRKIEKGQFEADTGKSFPWYQNDERGNPAQYAVCPACDNPIRIIALYKRRENSPPTHGRHTRRSVPGLTGYSQDAYDSCLYANPGIAHDPTRRRNENDPRGREILHLLREQFDKVIYIISRITGISISHALARNMLVTFLGMRGHLYVGTNMCNLPWMFAYLSNAQGLFGRRIRPDSPLRRVLEQHEKIRFIEDGRIQSVPGVFLDLTFCCMHHTIRHTRTSTIETVRFVVSEGRDTLYEEILEVDPMSFHEVVNASPERFERKHGLLEIAAELIPA